MAITLRGVGASGTGTSSVSNLAQPTGTATGDVLFAFIVDHATSGNSTVPTGWQYRGGAAGSAGRLQVFSAVVGANSLSGTSWTFSGLTTRSMGQVVGYYNVDQTGYGRVLSLSAQINASGTTGAPSITPPQNMTQIIAAFCSLANGCTWSGEAVATSPTIAEITGADNANSSYCSLALADGLQTSSVPTGASSATMSTNAANGGILLALGPLYPTGTLAGTLANLTGVMTGTVRAEGSLAGTLAQVTGSLAGTAGSGSGPVDFAPHDLTSETSHPPFVVSVSSQFSTFGADKAFDDATGNSYWNSNSPVCWLMIDTGNGNSFKLYSYAIKNPGNYIPARAPNTWTLEGSNDNSTWNTLDTRTSETGWANTAETRNYICATYTTSYRYFRLNITANNGDSGYSQVGELYLYSNSSSGVTGALAGTLANITGSVTGAHGVAGTATGTLANVTGSISGAHGVAGTVAGTLARVNGAVSGTVRAEGSLAGTLAPVTAAVVGAHGVSGTVAGSLGAISGVISGTAAAPGAVTGTLAGTLTQVTGALAGAHGVAGAVVATLGQVTGAISGTVRAEGSIAGVLATVTGTVTGVHGVNATVNGSLAAVTGAVTGTHGVTGVMAGTLAAVTGSFTGIISGVVTGTLAGTLQPVTAAINGTAGPDTTTRWKFPALFSASGFSYGDYDPGQAAAIAIGCLHLYMKTGDSRANTWARRILDDLRINRQSPTYPYLYKSDLHHGWLNAQVAQAFGLAVTGRPGQAYAFASTREDRDHFLNMVNQFFSLAGDSKPNVLNADLIPFSYVEAVSSWDYAPNYIMNQQMGSLEALVLMLEVALAYARLRGDWDWFNRLLAFILRDNLVVLNQAQIRTITAACDQAGAANLVRRRYADYDRDSSDYCEARDQTAIDNWGEQALDLDLRYGSPVILEDPAAAQLLASRMLQRLAPPQEAVEVETWLEGVRIELGDTAAVSADFYGWDREEFTVLGRDLDLGHRRVRLKLTRPLDRTDPFAVDAGGSASDAWAIDQASSWDENWDSRAYVY